MRLGFKLFLLTIALIALAAGLLPPLLDQGGLRSDANDAAHAGVAALLSGSSTSQVRLAVTGSISHHDGVKVHSVKVGAGQVTVIAEETVHTFLSRTPGLERWFHLTVSESASIAG